MPDSTVSRRATIEVPVNADVSKLKEVNKALDTIKTNSGSLSKVLDNANKSLQKLESSFKNSKVSKCLSEIGESADNAKLKLSRLKDDGAGSINAIEKSLSSASRSSASLTKSIDKSSDALTSHSEKLKAYADDYDKQMGSIKRTNDSAKDSFKRYKDSVQAGNKDMQEAAKKTSRTKAVPDTTRVNKYSGAINNAARASEKFSHTGWSMLGITGALGASFLKGAKDAASLQQSYKQITNLAVTSGEKRANVLKNVNAMTKENTDLSIKYGISQTDLAKGDEQLVHAGYSTNAALAAHKVLVQGAIATGQSYGDVMKNVTSILDQYQMRTDDANKMSARTKTVINETAYAVDHGKASFEQFGESMEYVGSTAHSTNQKLSQTMSALTILSKNGLNFLASQLEIAA